MDVTKLKKLIPWGVTILVAYLLAKLITTFVIEKIEIPSASMEPTIMIDDRLILNKFAYTFSNPKRGDIIVFTNPKGYGYDLIKRVIGLPGEIITLENDCVYINGKLLEEDYVHGKPTKADESTTFAVPFDCYFVMGDNRTNSTDSRSSRWPSPYVTNDMIKGKAVLRYKPSLGYIK